MILAVFVVLLVLFVVLPLIGWAVWFLVTAALTGIIIGGLARLVLPGRQTISVFATIVAGWIGSLVGSLIGRAAFGYHHHRIATLLIEIGISVVVVGAMEAGGRTSLRGSRRQPLSY